MAEISLKDKVYPVTKIAVVVEALEEVGRKPADALRGAQLSPEQLLDHSTRVSLSQVLTVYRNAYAMAPNPHFAYETGLRFHLASYGMYGFAILSGTDHRKTAGFAQQYHQLATPLTDIAFKEENGCGVWTFMPLPHEALDAELYRFVIDMQFGQTICLYRDVMGGEFRPVGLEVTYPRPSEYSLCEKLTGCSIAYQKPVNKLMFDASWLDGTARLGNQVTFSSVSAICKNLVKELDYHTGLAGRVRELLLSDVAHSANLAAASSKLKTAPRTLRRRLQEEGTSFREIVEEVRTKLAIKYIRETNLTVEDIAFALGFSDAANFRSAFRRWTGKSPNQLRTSKGHRGTSRLRIDASEVPKSPD